MSRMDLPFGFDGHMYVVGEILIVTNRKNCIHVQSNIKVLRRLLICSRLSIVICLLYYCNNFIIRQLDDTTVLYHYKDEEGEFLLGHKGDKDSP